MVTRLRIGFLRRNRSLVRRMTRGHRRAGCWSALRLVVQEQQARMAGMHSVDYSTLVRFADWRRRPATAWGLLVALASGGRAKCRSGASIHTATAQRAAEPSEPTSQTPRRWPPAPALQREGRVLFAGPSVPGAHRTSRDMRSSGQRLAGKRGIGPLAPDRSTTVKHRCTPTRPRKRGFTAAWKEAPAHRTIGTLDPPASIVPE